MSKAVVLTAAAARTALGEDLQATRRALSARATALASPPGAGSAVHARCARIWTEDLEPEDDPALRILGPHGRLLDPLARAAHEAGGLGELARERVGLFVALPMVDTPGTEFDAALRQCAAPQEDPDLGAFFAGAWRSIHPLWPLSALGNVAAGQVSIDLDVRGDNVVLASQADAGVQVLHEALRSLRMGHCDAALVGGVSGRVDEATWLRWRLTGALAPDGSGVRPGEGGAVLVLERALDAQARARPVLATLRGTGLAFGAGPGPGPTRAAIQRALEDALHDAGTRAGDVDVVHLHAQGTAVPDDAESQAVAELLPRARTVRLKPQLGHLGPGAPLVDLAVALPASPKDATGVVVVLALGSAGGASAAVLDGR